MESPPCRSTMTRWREAQKSPVHTADETSPLRASALSPSSFVTAVSVAVRVRWLCIREASMAPMNVAHRVRFCT
jgi:hypothetical protein